MTFELFLQTTATSFSLLLEIFLGQFMLYKILDFRTLCHRSLYVSLFFILHAVLLFLEEYCFSSFLGDIFWIYLSLHAVLFILFAFILCKGHTAFKFFFPLIYVSMITLCRFPISILINLFSGKLSGKIIFTLNIYNKSIFPSVLLTLCVYFFIRFHPNVHLQYPLSYHLVMILTPLLNSFSVILLKNHFDAISDTINYIGTFALFSELLLYYMVWQLTSEYSSRIQFQLINQQKDYQQQHMKELNAIVTEYHHLRHDTKNHFACMDRLLSQNKYDALKEYFYSLSKEIYALDNQIETGNEIINQVINIKYATARKYDIPMELQILLPPKLNIPDYLLCSLLSNLLDNALEASRNLEQPEIRLEMKIVKAYLSLTIRNRISSDVEAKALTIRTTKTDPTKQHGLGRQIIDDIVYRYNGISTKEIKDGWYLASIMLELPEESVPSEKL